MRRSPLHSFLCCCKSHWHPSCLFLIGTSASLIICILEKPYCAGKGQSFCRLKLMICLSWVLCRFCDEFHPVITSFVLFGWCFKGCSVGGFGLTSNAPEAAGCGHTCDRSYPSIHSLQTRGRCCYKPRVCHRCLQQHYLWCEPKLCPHGHWWLACGGVCLRAHWWRG